MDLVHAHSSQQQHAAASMVLPCMPCSKQWHGPPGAQGTAPTTSCPAQGQQQRHAIAFVVTLWGQPSGRARQALDCAVLSFDEVMARGQDQGGSFRPAPASPDTLATLVYTSGTTGQPKVRPLD